MDLLLCTWPANTTTQKLLKHLSQRCNTNIQCSFGWTAIHYAAINSHLDVVTALLSAGCDIEITDNDGHRAGDLATNMEIRTLLLGDEAMEIIKLKQAANLEARITIAKTEEKNKAKTSVQSKSGKTSKKGSNVAMNTKKAGKIPNDKKDDSKGDKSSSDPQLLVEFLQKCMAAMEELEPTDQVHFQMQVLELLDIEKMDDSQEKSAKLVDNLENVEKYLDMRFCGEEMPPMITDCYNMIDLMKTMFQG
ncbi:uncharacterized protein LOC106153982 [Lingula anatina]|uniref:Uncharacterized protein LOC106153982 n=1 Tax=Lingula anatina TaxID=7574 RepID=A0A1S3HC75_LINAN|nr:uncharacterized protein LOC106153982 [Lingula anatina]|eukprot:XP_013383600.1 uncharacterized protein LOC106153982 [Lingula anatina]